MKKKIAIISMILAVVLMASACSCSGAGNQGTARTESTESTEFSTDQKKGTDPFNVSEETTVVSESPIIPADSDDTSDNGESGSGWEEQITDPEENRDGEDDNNSSYELPFVPAS